DGAFAAQLLHGGYRPGGAFKEEPGQNRSRGREEERDSGGCERIRRHQAPQGFGQQPPVQRRRPCATDAPYEDRNGERCAAPRLSEQNHMEEKRVLVAQSPYVSLNLHHVWAKHVPPGPYALSHLTDGYRGEEVNPYLYRTQSPANDAHRVPHYIGTSVIISNE
ncbi:hypothetical protein M9458_022717, partial [Cirrhinus mrigala]